MGFLYETRLRPACAYTFKHALIHEVAYQSLLANTRQQVQQRIAQVMERRFPDVVVTQLFFWPNDNKDRREDTVCHKPGSDSVR